MEGPAEKLYTLFIIAFSSQIIKMIKNCSIKQFCKFLFERFSYYSTPSAICKEFFDIFSKNLQFYFYKTCIL